MSKPEVVVVDHYDSYTYNLVHLIASVTGALPSVVSHDQVSAADVLRFSHVVLSPGPGHPAVAKDFAVGNEVLLAGSRPVLGVCLGMQGLVTAYGGVVDRLRPAHGEVAELNHDEKGLFAGLPQRIRVVRYHSLGALELPDELLVTATCQGPADEAPVVMGVRHHSLPLVGVQFHPESILSEFGAQMVVNFFTEEC